MSPLDVAPTEVAQTDTALTDIDSTDLAPNKYAPSDITHTDDTLIDVELPPNDYKKSGSGLQKTVWFTQFKQYLAITRRPTMPVVLV